MKLLKAKQPQQEAAAAVSLAGRIRATCAEARACIQKEVQRIKKSPEGELISVVWLEQNLRAVNRTGGCDCKLALKLLEPKQ